MSEPQVFRAERVSGCLATPVAPRKRMEWPSTFEYLVVCGYTAVYLYMNGS